MNNFQVYTHEVNKGDGRFIPFYVGKGRPKRAKNMSRNRHHDNVVKKYGVKNIRVSLWGCDLSEESAFACEVELIAFMRDEGVRLTNKTNGGEGTSGCVHSNEARMNMSLAAKGRAPASQETRAKMSAVMKGRTHSDETKLKLSVDRKGNKHCLGRVLSAETKAKMSVAGKGNKHGLGKRHSIEARAKMSAANKGKIVSEETRAKLSARNKGKRYSDEIKAKMSAAQKERYKRQCVEPDGALDQVS